MFSSICARINDWVNNREAGDLRPYRGHYDVNVMLEKANIDIEEIAVNSLPDIPIWDDSRPVTVDFTLSEFDKSSTSTVSMN